LIFGAWLMTDPAIRLDELTNILKARGFRLTPQRLAVLKILATSDGHPSVEHIYAQIKQDFPTTSLGTVYKTISLLKEIGEVLELGFADDVNRYDGNKPYPHPHLICVKCKHIIDPEIAEARTAIQEAAEMLGYQVLSYRFDVYGICPQCQAKP
jgi:Fur family peroxide stress response transcriptional regulator